MYYMLGREGREGDRTEELMYYMLGRERHEGAGRKSLCIIC